MPLDRARQFLQFGLGCFLAGALVIAWLLLRHGSADMPISSELAFFGSFVVSGSGLLVAWVGWRTLRLGSASQAFATWRVSEAEWQRYVAACRLRETMPGALPGAVPLDLVVPPDGIEVLALRRGFRVGDSFHEIGTLGAEVLDIRVVDAPADLFEFNVLYSTGRSSSVQRGVRIPIAAESRLLTQQVEDYWLAREPLQAMTRDELRARERSGLWMVAAGILGFLGVIALFVMINPPGWAAIAPISSLGVLFWGLFRLLRARVVRGRKFGA